MISGLYISREGMKVRMVAQDIIANNVANINTSGYKRDVLTFHSLLEETRIAPLSEYEELIRLNSEKYGVEPNLIKAVIMQESGGNKFAVSPKGAKGLMQLMDSTAEKLGVTDVFNPAENIAAGTRYLKELIDEFGSTRLALAGYNAGPESVRKYNGIPPFAETRGFIESVLSYQKLFELKQEEYVVSAPLYIEKAIDKTQGSLKETKVPFDLALSGDGFFEVKTSNGIRYTRNGNFTRNEDGILVTQQGFPVLGELGYITVEGKDFNVTKNGDIFVDGEKIDRLSIKDFSLLRKEGNNLYVPLSSPKEVEPKVMQGYLEDSNVNPIDEAVNIVLNARFFWMNQRVFTVQDMTLETAVTQLGKV